MERPDDMHQAPFTGPDPEVDAIYEAMTPRLRAARRSHVRARFGAALAIPLALGAGLAYGAGRSDTATAQLAAGRTAEIPADLGEPAPTAAPEPTAEPAPFEGPKDHADESAEPESSDTTLEWQWVELSPVGKIQVAVTDAGVVLGEAHLEPGWSVEVVTADETVAVLVLTGDEGSVLVTIAHDGTGHLHVDLDEIAIEPGPAPTPTPKSEEKDEQAEPTPKPTPEEAADPTPKPTPEPTPKEEPKDEREMQTRKEIDVSDVGRVVVEREGEKLWLGVTWHHQWWTAVVVVEYGPEVHAYFTNDGFEYHVRAWASPHRIKHETWVVEPETAAYDGWVSCGFGAVGVLVEGNIARVMSVEEHEGSDWVIVTEVGEVVKVKFVTAEQTWILEAWGDGRQVVSSCRQK